MPTPPAAAILIIGNEILSGRTQDVNIRFIASRLALRGIKLAEVRVVRDEKTAIIKAARELNQEYAYVFSTGGIGPTHDDITAACLAEAFGAALEINAEARRRMDAYYKEKNVEFNEGRLRMARIPAGARLIDNPISAAPGFIIGNVYVMAGVPEIMQAMFHGFENGLVQRTPMLCNTVTCALREGDIAIELENIQKKYADVEIGSYPSQNAGAPHLSLVLRATDEKKLAAATDKVFALVKKRDDEAGVAYQSV